MEEHIYVRLVPDVKKETFLGKRTSIGPSGERNINQGKWNILFGRNFKEWMTFRPDPNIVCYSCYFCRKMYTAKPIFLDHVNRRGMVITYNCPQCSQVLTFYNPCSFMLHAREHFGLFSGEINLENVTFSAISRELIGFIPHRNIPFLYDVIDDDVGENTYIKSKFYLPTYESMGKPIINFISNELHFYPYDINATPLTALILKQISSNIPRCRFIVYGEHNKSINEDDDKKENLEVEIDIKDEPLSEIEEFKTKFKDPPVNNEDELKFVPKTFSPKYPTCIECGEIQTIPMMEHFLHTDKPFQDSLRCSICSYIAPTKCSLKAHERIHEAVFPFVCPECGKDFNSVESLYSHLEDVCFHLTKQVRLRCPGKRCGKIFAQAVTFSAHFLNHMECMNECSTCHVVFSTMPEFIQHSKEHVGNVLPISIYKCGVCINEAEYFTKDTYQNHIHEHATNKKQCLYVYLCKHCHGYFRSTVTYATHLLRCSHLIHKSKVPVTIKKNSFLLNTKRRFNDLQAIGYCQSCRTEIRTSKQDVENINIKCPNCNLPFHFDIIKNNLNNNSVPLLVTTDEPPKTLQCVLCDVKFTETELHEHNVKNECKYNNPVVIIDTDPKNNSPDSNKTEVNKEKVSKKSDGIKRKRRKASILLIKRVRKSPISNSDTEVSTTLPSPIVFNGTYYCIKCDYKDSDRNTFREHIITHRDINPCYQCIECGYCNSIKATLEKHLNYYHNIIDIDKYLEENDCYYEDAMNDVNDCVDLLPGTSKKCVAENQCKECLQQFNNATELTTHFLIHGMAIVMKKSKQLHDL